MVDFLVSPLFLLFARLCVGGVFVASGLTKLFDKPGTAANLSRYPFLPVWSRRLIANFFPYVELAAGLLLLLGLLTRLAALASLLLFVLFTALIVYDLARGNDTSCHCFGKLSDDKLTPMAVVRNIVLMLLALLVVVGFDGWLAIDSSLAGSSTGGFGLVAHAITGTAPSFADSVPVILLALAGVLVIVLGGPAASTVRTTLRGLGFR